MNGPNHARPRALSRPTHAGPGLASLLAAGQVFAPGCHDCLSAAVLQRSGARSLFLSGAGVAASVAGVPDLGLSTMTELVTAAGNIIAGASVPVIVDADTGFGNELNTARTVATLGRLGASAVMVEDQEFPKRCGHLADKSVVSRSEFRRKLMVALEVCAEFEMLLIARTDSLAALGIDEALARAAMAHDLGARLTFVEAPRTIEDVARIGDGPGLKMYNAATGGSSPSLSFVELAELGFSLVIDPGVSLYPLIAGIDSAFREIEKSGDFRAMQAYKLRPRDIFEQVELGSWLGLDTAMEDK